MSTLLKTQHICKSFSGNKVLNDVGIEVKAGECIALVGENGAGKSTLMKIISGIYHADSGEIYLHDKKVEINSPIDAQKSGISIIHQELSLIPNLTVAQNIFLGNEPGKAIRIDDAEMYRLTEELLDKLGISINPKASVLELSIAEQQLVEIAKVLSKKADIIIMDEPTASLSPDETGRLFQIIEDLKKNGKGIIYISHRLEEIHKIAQSIYILRDGMVVSKKDVNAPVNEIVEAMVGQSIQNYYPRVKVETGEVVLEVTNLGDGKHYKNISFQVRRGEVYGIAGLVGAGQLSLARGIFGLSKPKEGKVLVNGKSLERHNPTESIEHGIGLITESRKEEGLILMMSVKENIGLSPWAPMKHRFGRINNKDEIRVAEKNVKDFDIRTDSIYKEVMLLSGGNQQKVVIAMTLVAAPDVVIMCEPTRGVDVNGKVEIYNIINILLQENKAVLLISSEIPEVLGMSDRVAVMYKGKIVFETDQKMTQEEIMTYATGGHKYG